MGETRRMHNLGAAPDGPALDLRVSAWLFCAEQDERELRALAPSLAPFGVRLVVVSGAELDERVLGDTLDLVQGPALITVVVSEQLGRSHARRLGETFMAHRGASQRLLVLELQRGRAVRFVGALIRAAQGLRSTEEIDRRSGARLTASSSRNRAACGERQVPVTAMESVSVRVYEAPVIIAESLRDNVGVIPAHVRLPARIERSRRLLAGPVAEPAPESASTSASTKPDMLVQDVLADVPDCMLSTEPASGQVRRPQRGWGVFMALADVLAGRKHTRRSRPSKPSA